jgi:16S rRNA processing protein RimM
VAAAALDNRILMGRIGAAHGIKGEVRVQSFAEDPLALARYGTFLTNRPGFTVTIASARGTTNMLVATIEGVDDRTAAEELNGVELYIEREALPPPGEEEFYHGDLIGLRAQLADGTEVGTVGAVLNFGPATSSKSRRGAGQRFSSPSLAPSSLSSTSRMDTWSSSRHSTRTRATRSPADVPGRRDHAVPRALPRAPRRVGDRAWSDRGSLVAANHSAQGLRQ